MSGRSVPVSPAADRLRASGAVALALVPVVMAAANRSSPLVVGIAALLFLAAELIEDWRAALRRLAAPLGSPLGLTVLAFAAWCLVSVTWSPFSALSLRVAAEFLPTLAAAYLLARLAPGHLPPATARLAGLMLALAGLYVVGSLAADLAVQKALGQRVALFVFNRPAMTMLLIGIPLAALLLRRGDLIAGGLTLALGLTAILRSVSGAATLGLAAALATWLVVRIVPRRVAVGMAGLGLGLAVALAPVEGDLLHRVMPESLHERLVQSSSRARVAIARSFGAAVAADPWRGAGYGTAGRFAETPIAAGLEPEMRSMLAVGHPHNSFLQVWAELGIVGATLAAAALFLMLGSVASLPRAELATVLALVAAAAAIAFVEHGAWQAWWVAGLGAAITWSREGFVQAAAATTRFRPSALAR